jgi:hypothetical protein
MSDASPETFADAFALLAAAADVKGCEARITKLKKLSEQVAAAQAKLETERATHDRKVVADTAAMDERELKLRDREIKARLQESNLKEREQRLAAEQPERYPPNPNFFGLD